MYKFCACAQGIHTESACVAEKVQHPASCRIPAHEGPIVPLVEEKACLLTFLPVHYEFPGILADRKTWAVEAFLSVKISVHQFKSGLERSRSGALVIDSLERVSYEFAQGLANLGFGAEHPHGMSLEHAYSVIPVYD